MAVYSRAVVQAEWEKELINDLGDRLGVDPRTDPRPEIVAGAAMSALRVSIRRWTASHETEDLPSLVAAAFDALASISDLAQPPAVVSPLRPV